MYCNGHLIIVKYRTLYCKKRFVLFLLGREISGCSIENKSYHLPGTSHYKGIADP